MEKVQLPKKARKDLSLVGKGLAIITCPPVYFGVWKFLEEKEKNIYIRTKKALTSVSLVAIVSTIFSLGADGILADRRRLKNYESVHSENYSITLINENETQPTRPYLLKAAFFPIIRYLIPKTYKEVELGTRFFGTVRSGGLEYNVEGNFPTRVDFSKLTVEDLAKYTKTIEIEESKKNVSAIYGINEDFLD